MCEARFYKAFWKELRDFFSKSQQQIKKVKIKMEFILIPFVKYIIRVGISI